MSNGSSYCYLSYDVICILRLVDQKTTLPRVITLLHFPLRDCTNVVWCVSSADTRLELNF